MFLTEPQGEPSREHSVKPLDEVGSLMLATAGAIEQQGLPCSMVDQEGRTCVILTMGRLSAGKPWLVERAIQRLTPHVGYVHLWSDEAGRQGLVAEVVAKLRAVALGG